MRSLTLKKETGPHSCKYKKYPVDFAGNFLTVKGMWSERTTSATPYLLIHLAVADVILLFSFWFYQFCQTMFNVYGMWESWERVFAYVKSQFSLVTTFAHIVGRFSNIFKFICCVIRVFPK